MANVTLVAADNQTPVGMGTGGLPVGATSVSGTSGNIAAATAAASLPAVAAKTNYCTGFSFMGFGATGATGIVTGTLTGLAGGTQTFFVSVPAGVAVAISPFPLVVNFPVPLAASAVNTAITISFPTLGVGSTNAVANIQGYVL